MQHRHWQKVFNLLDYQMGGLDVGVHLEVLTKSPYNAMDHLEQI
jgi:hypothetical protein